MNESAVYSLAQLVRYFLKLGTIGFGGPVALVGYMHRDLVEARRWISEADYKDGLTLAQLMPGPLAAQLAMYLGYVHYGTLGASLVGIAFVLPSISVPRRRERLRPTCTSAACPGCRRCSMGSVRL